MDVLLSELDTVPVFGILVVADGKLYGGPEGKESRIQPAMVYTQLADANQVLGKLTEAYPGIEFSLQPLSLGAVMRQSGMLGDGNREALDDGAEVGTRAVLVASPDQKRAARKIRADRAASNAMGTEDEPSAAAAAAATASVDATPGPPKVVQVPLVPVFHCGPLTWREAEDEPPSTLWPLFFRVDDLETMWRQVGGDAPQPPPEVTDLAALLSPEGGLPAEAASARLLLCAPLDAIDYMRSHTAALAAETKTEVMPADGDAAAVRQVLKRAVEGPVTPDILDDRPMGGSEPDSGWL